MARHRRGERRPSGRGECRRGHGDDVPWLQMSTVEGVPVGEEIKDLQACYTGDTLPGGRFAQGMKPCAQRAELSPRGVSEGMGSIIVLVATDAPLLPHQLGRIARRVPLAIGKMGGLGEDSSGDIFLAFSTQPVTLASSGRVAQVGSLATGI